MIGHLPHLHHKFCHSFCFSSTNIRTLLPAHSFAHSINRELPQAAPNTKLTVNQLTVFFFPLSLAAAGEFTPLHVQALQASSWPPSLVLSVDCSDYKGLACRWTFCCHWTSNQLTKSKTKKKTRKNENLKILPYQTTKTLPKNLF